ncbi:MAG: recombination protein NinG [Bacteroidales bacterium]
MTKKQKTIGKLLQEAQKYFNAYIRQRDKDMPCISSGEYCDNKDCGHFFPVSTHSGLRFDEDNAHGESIRMNRFDEGHLIPYRENLLKRIGKKRFDALYERAAEYKRNGYKWSRSELLEKIQYYKELVK